MPEGLPLYLSRTITSEEKVDELVEPYPLVPWSVSDNQVDSVNG